MTHEQDSSLASLRNRIELLEQQLAAKRPIRVDKVEYKIDKLYVESIDHGILDLGVHLGGERPRLPAAAAANGQGAAQPCAETASADYADLDQRLCALEATVETMQEELETWRAKVEERIGRLERQ